MAPAFITDDKDDDEEEEQTTESSTSGSQGPPSSDNRSKYPYSDLLLLNLTSEICFRLGYCFYCFYGFPIHCHTLWGITHPS